MKRIANIAAITLCFSSAQAVAETSVEVMHFWTSGGEAAALGVIRDKVVEAGIEWQDAPVAGGGGDQAKTALQTRIAAGDPPAAMLMLGQNIIDWANEGILGDVNALAETEGWDDVLPQAVQDFNKINGAYVAAPTNVHRTDMIWASRAAFDTIGADFPTTWDEFNALAPRFVEAGIVPIAHGGQAWQEAYMFEALVLGVGGADFYRAALVDLDPEALRSETMQSVFAQMAGIRGMVDEDFSGRDWNLASAMVINGEAAMQIMGDWAKGEFTNAGQVAGEDFACIPVPKTDAGGFVYLVNSLSFFAQPDAEAADAQATLASAIMDPEVQVAFNQAKGAIPARTDVDFSALDACAQASAADFSASDTAGTAVPTFAGTHAAQASVVGAATDVITEFFNTDMTPEDAAEQLAEAVELAL
ncbi:MAG: ABC transporter substrate-binding protein [Pseudomonadota bacterium]|jgi:glucose/mannose transport system substrate-binding protein|uniref:ABC transporter substrate-binding protein n=1 Tax=Thalassovita sp. TaxID=1979401 RepID=UPI002AB2707A|nr:ABC transporter substrate-binding protein [Thalassovita sp.]MEC8039160.1 ABC transporter substrate-binding protein [Pseudomonadota bacterium]